jgi:hypothetical protein
MGNKTPSNRRPRVPLKCERESKAEDFPSAPHKPEPVSEDSPTEPFPLSLPRCQLKLKFLVGSKAYGYAWLQGLAVSHPNQYATIGAILNAVLESGGGDISQKQVTKHNQQVANYVEKERFVIIPKNGCVMSDNGDNIRHAKYSKSKNIAVLWLCVGQTIYYTFDDHGGVTFHRGIYVLQSIQHGRNVGPIKQRTPQRIVRELAQSQLTSRRRKAYEKKFQLNGTIVSFKKLKLEKKSRVTERQLRESSNGETL